MRAMPGGEGQVSEQPPGGKPIVNVTNLEDVEWMLTRARRFILRGGDRTDPRYVGFVNRWLDYRNEIAPSSAAEEEGT